MTASIDPLATTPVSVQKVTDVTPSEKAASKSNSNSSAASASKYGPAVYVTLSDPAQAIVNGKVNATGTVAASDDKPADPTVGKVPANENSVRVADPDKDGDVDTAQEVSAEPAKESPLAEKEPEDSIAKSKRKVQSEVGVVGANQVVDSQGNIDRIKLNEMLEKDSKSLAS